MKQSSLQTSKRNLPHWTRNNAVYWVTFRMADSIPHDKLRQWNIYRDRWMTLNPTPWSSWQKMEYQERFGNQIEDWMDAGFGSCALKKPACRKEVVNCILRFHGERHQLHHAVVMPNHVHLIIEPFLHYRLSAILGGMKSASARACNTLLQTSGTFWMQESYDHIIRSQGEFRHYWAYIEQNPIKARLPKGAYWLMPQ